MKRTRYKLLIHIYVCFLLCSFVNVLYAFPDGGKDGGVCDFTLGKPTTIMALSDTPGYDNIDLGQAIIVQVDKSLYYLYYSCNGSLTDNNSDYAPARYKYWDKEKRKFDTHDGGLHIAFAYSTDGINWIKGFPKGISLHTDSKGNPIGITGDILPKGTNLLNYIGLSAYDLVKVPDEEYPFRLIANEMQDMEHYVNKTHVCMWKSRDGINFEKKIEILPDKYDGVPSIIVRGNIMKVFHRMRSQSSNKKRVIGVMCLDLNGVILSPLTTIIDDFYYNSAASLLDDRREILFPTYFDQKSPNRSHYDAFIVDGNNVLKCSSSTRAFMVGDDRFGLVMPHIIEVAGVHYILYYQTNKWHHGDVYINQSETGRSIKELRLIPIYFGVKGRPCPPSLRK